MWLELRIVKNTDRITYKLTLRILVLNRKILPWLQTIPHPDLRFH